LISQAKSSSQLDLAYKKLERYNHWNV
jgi:hypothetical protein